MKKFSFFAIAFGSALSLMADPMGQLATAAEDALADLSTAVGPILIAAFVIAVAFVAYKLIKRAINKA